MTNFKNPVEFLQTAIKQGLSLLWLKKIESNTYASLEEEQDFMYSWVGGLNTIFRENPKLSETLSKQSTQVKYFVAEYFRLNPHQRELEVGIDPPLRARNVANDDNCIIVYLAAYYENTYDQMVDILSFVGYDLCLDKDRTEYFTVKLTTESVPPMLQLAVMAIVNQWLMARMTLNQLLGCHHAHHARSDGRRCLVFYKALPSTDLSTEMFSDDGHYVRVHQHQCDGRVKLLTRWEGNIPNRQLTTIVNKDAAGVFFSETGIW